MATHDMHIHSALVESGKCLASYSASMLHAEKSGMPIFQRATLKTLQGLGTRLGNVYLNVFSSSPFNLFGGEANKIQKWQ